MENKYKVGIAVATVVVSFATGRYTVPEKIKVETRTVTVEKTVVETDKDKNKNTKIVKIERPDGTKETTTEITEISKVDQTAVGEKTYTSDTLKEVTKANDLVTISALAGLDIKSGSSVFGASISKPILGPISLGAWGLTNATVGASIGIGL